MDDNAKNLIDDVEDIRRSNNGLWMDLLRIAIDHAPKEAREILRGINRNDSQINKLLVRLADEED